MLLEFNVEADKMTSHILKDECATELETKSIWIPIEQQAMTIECDDDSFGFTAYSQPVTGAPPVIVIGGCSGSLALSGIAMLTSLGAITVLVVKKKED